MVPPGRSLPKRRSRSRRRRAAFSTYSRDLEGVAQPQPCHRDLEVSRYRFRAPAIRTVAISDLKRRRAAVSRLYRPRAERPASIAVDVVDGAGVTTGDAAGAGSPVAAA
jgi:hypothetical protein